MNGEFSKDFFWVFGEDNSRRELKKHKVRDD